MHLKEKTKHTFKKKTVTVITVISQIISAMCILLLLPIYSSMSNLNYTKYFKDNMYFLTHIF